MSGHHYRAVSSSATPAELFDQAVSEIKQSLRSFTGGMVLRLRESSLMTSLAAPVAAGGGLRAGGPRAGRRPAACRAHPERVTS